MGGRNYGERNKALLTYLVLFVFFGGLYFGWGITLAKAGAYTHLSALLKADHGRVIRDLTDVSVDHSRTAVHPLFVLILNPLGVLLAKGLGSRSAAAVLMSSVAGALCVVMAGAFLRRAGLRGFHATAFAAILGFSATHIFFASTPETWIFAAAGVILLYLLAVWVPGSTLRFLPAGVFALGMATPSLVTAAIAFAGGIYKRVSFKFLLAKTALFGVLVTACAAFLSLAQKLLYPGSAIFFLPGVYGYEFGSYSPIIKYFNDLPFGYVLARLGKLVSVLFLYNFIAPVTVTRWYSAGEYCLPQKPFVELDIPRLTPLGIAAAAFWVGLIIWGAYSFIKNKGSRPPILFALLLTFAFYFIFYSVYGTALYIYAISCTFPLLASLALALRPYGRPGTKGFYALGGFLVCFLILEAVSNIYFLRQILAAFRDYPFPM